MATIEIDGDAFEVEILSAQHTPPTFSLRIQYETETGTGRDTVALDVDARSDLTVSFTERRLRSWLDDHDGATVTSFEIVEETPARRGRRTGSYTSRSGAAESGNGDGPHRTRRPAYGTSNIQSMPNAEQVDGTEDYEPGDHVAYVVDGPDAGVYSHTTDGIVQAVPPYRPGPTGDPVRDAFLVDVGERRPKQVPVEKVVGHVDDDDVTVDHPHDLPAVEGGETTS